MLGRLLPGEVLRLLCRCSYRGCAAAVGGWFRSHVCGCLHFKVLVCCFIPRSTLKFLCLPVCITCLFLANVADFARAVVKKRGGPPDNYSENILEFLRDHRPGEADRIRVSGVLFYFADSTLSMQDLYDVMMELFPKHEKHILALIQ